MVIRSTCVDAGARRFAEQLAGVVDSLGLVPPPN